MKRFFIPVCIVAFTCFTAKAQDIHFSQFNYTPILLNPANAGAYDGEHRAFLNYKDQWNSVSAGKTYRTAAAAYDVGLFKNKWDNSYIGLGVFLFQDKAGDSNMGTTQGNISVSSLLSVSDQSIISAGLQAGFGQRSIDLNNPDLMWDNQFNGEAYDPTLPSGENTFSNSVAYPDISAGVAWHYGTESSTLSSNNELKATVGAAMHHVNKPKIAFGNSNDRLHSKIIGHGSLYIGIKNSVGAIIPSAIYMKQGPHQEINFGAMFKYALTENSKVTGEIKESAILLGGYYRVGDAFVPAASIEYSGFSLGVSYDFNLSDLTIASQGRGGFEVALRYIHKNINKGEKSNVRFM